MDYFLEIKRAQDLDRLTIIGILVLTDTRLTAGVQGALCRALLERRAEVEHVQTIKAETGLIVSIY